MTTRWASFVIWAAVMASVTFWVLRLLAPSIGAPGHTVTVSAAGLARGDLTRVLGEDDAPVAEAQQEAPAEDRRFQLVGVVAPRSSPTARPAVALIAIDGNPPKAYRIGAVVDGETVLQSVSARGAELGPADGPATVSLSTPPLPPPATGVLPSLTAGQPPPAERPARPGQRPALPPPPPASPSRDAPDPPEPPDDDQEERRARGAATR